VTWANDYDPKEVYVVERTPTAKEVHRSKARSRDGSISKYYYRDRVPSRVNAKRDLVKDALSLK
jgi:hypothetical protein